MANEEIRMAAFVNGVTWCSAADELGIRPETLSRWLRKELPEEKKQMVIDAIHKAHNRERTA